MSTIEIEHQNLNALGDAYGEVQLALDLQHAKIERLIEQTFESKERAIRAMIALTRGYGAEATIKLLEDRGAMSRAWYFGFLRGHLFARGARTAARTGLSELPQALREREALMAKRDDLLRARRQILERIDRDRFEDGRTSSSRTLPTSRQHS